MFLELKIILINDFFLWEKLINECVKADKKIMNILKLKFNWMKIKEIKY